MVKEVSGPWALGHGLEEPHKAEAPPSALGLLFAPASDSPGGAGDWNGGARVGGAQSGAGERTTILKEKLSWAGWLSWLARCPVRQKVGGLIPG